MAKLTAHTETGIENEIPVLLGDTWFTVIDNDIFYAYLDSDSYGETAMGIGAALARLGIGYFDVVDAAHDGGTVESDFTAEHLADLFGCDPGDVR